MWTPIRDTKLSETEIVRGRMSTVLKYPGEDEVNRRATTVDRKEYNRKYYEKNRDKLLKRQREYESMNRDKALERNKEWRKKNSEKRKLQSKAYYERNKEKEAQRKAKYRSENLEKLRHQARESFHKNKFTGAYIVNYHNSQARRKGIEGTFTLVEWNELREKYRHACLYCRKTEPEIKLSPDHVVPLSRGGQNYISNIQPLCSTCNAKKEVKNIDYRS